MSLELAIVFPAVLLIVMATLSVGLWFHGRNLALAAAQEGVRAARTHQDPADASNAALNFARTAGSSFLKDPAATMTENGDTIEVTVTGHAVTLVPGLNLQISQVARAPRERFTTPEDK